MNLKKHSKVNLYSFNRVASSVCNSFLFVCLFFWYAKCTGDVKGMEALIDLSANEVPVIGHTKSTFSVEKFVDDVIDYHNNLENEMPTKYVIFYFYETDNTTVVEKTVDLLKRKENEVNAIAKRMSLKS